MSTEKTSTYDPKVISIVSFIGLIGWIVAIVLNNPKNEQASFHIRQALGIHLFSLIWIIPVIGWLIGIAVFVLWIVGLVYAIQGKNEPIPVVGKYFQDWFSSL